MPKEYLDGRPLISAQLDSSVTHSFYLFEANWVINPYWTALINVYY